MKCRFLLCCLICFSICICATGNATVSGTGGGRLNLTPPEKAWLAAHPVVRVRVSRDYPPFEFYDNGRFQGISFDILTLIGTQLGIEFRPTPEMPWKDALESLKRKDGTDLVLMITKDNSRTGFIEFTNNYIAFPQVIITRKDSKFISGIKDLSGETVATENGFIQADEIKRDIAAVTVLETSNTTTSLEAVATGKADAYIGNLAVVSYLIEKKRLANLKVAAPSNYPVDDYAMGVRKDWPELARIIEKAVAAIPEEENRKIHQKWLSVRYEHGLRPIDIFKWVVAVSGILVVFIVQLRVMVRKRTIALKKSEEEYRNIFENAPIGIFQSVPGGRFITVNSVYAEIFGYATADEMIEEVTDISTQLYANPAQRDSIMQQLETDGHVIVPDLEAKRKDGTRIYADLFMRAVRGEGGSIERFEGFLADVTSRKQLLDDLVEREERLRLYIKRIPIACILFDKDLCIQNWNPAAERIFGYQEEEVLGRSAYELIVPEQVQSQVSGRLKQLMDDDVDASAINENRTKDGRTILCEWVNTPFRDNKGNLVGMISMAQDITGRKKAEEIMMQSEKMSMIAGMAAGMAHEVNNPLGVITQDIQNLERRFSPTLPGNRKVAEELGLDLALVNEYMEQRSIAEFITNMRSAAKRASTIIGNMLQFSRQSDIGHQELNISEILEQSVKLAANDYDLRKKYDFKNIAITRDYGQNLPTVSLSVTEIEQVFINILKNAAQAMFDADVVQPAITITTSQSDGCVEATITDNGPGMADDVRLHIFDPFFTTKAVGSGTGLGMSVSYAIITKNHNGSLTVDSKPGQGACFTVRLPLSRPK